MAVDITGLGNSFTANYGDATKALTITTGVTAPLDIDAKSTTAVHIKGDYNGGGEIFTANVEGGVERFSVKPGYKSGSFTKEQVGKGIEVTGSAVIEGIKATEGADALKVTGTAGKDTIVLTGTFNDYQKPIKISAAAGDTVVLNGLTINQKEPERKPGAAAATKIPLHKQAVLLELDLGDADNLIIKGGQFNYRFVDLDGDGKSIPKNITNTR